MPAGYLWIPDIPSLSGKKFYNVFRGPFATEELCKIYLKVFELEPYITSTGRQIECYCKKVSAEAGSENPEDDEIKLNSQKWGDPQRENNPSPPDIDTDFSGMVSVELIVNDLGKAIRANSSIYTNHPDEAVVKFIIDYVKKNIKYKAEPGAPIRKAYYKVYVSAG